MTKKLFSFMLILSLVFQILLVPISQLTYADGSHQDDLVEENSQVEDVVEEKTLEKVEEQEEVINEEKLKDKDIKSKENKKNVDAEEQEKSNSKEQKETVTTKEQAEKTKEEKTKDNETKSDETKENENKEAEESNKEKFVEKEPKEENKEKVEDEEEVIPIEEEITKSSGKVKTFSSHNKLANIKEESARHVIEPVETDNMCLREIEGTIEINLPVPTEKKPIDVVVVQDASGSYSGNESQVKQSLKDIVDMLDLTQDRMMVTSYRDFDGWKQYNNTSDYNAGKLRPESRGYTNPRSSGTTGLKTVNHSGLSNNADRLKNSIDAIRFGGATPTASGLEFAKNEYQSATSGENLSDRETVFILITDGVANIQLDGYIHLNRQLGTAWAESNQFYQQTFDEVLSVANSIKGQGYEMISAYWENTSVLRSAYGRDYYNNTIGPAARQMLRNVASSPNNYSQSEDLAELISNLLANLQTTINQYSGFQTEFDIAPGFELVENSVYLNGNQVTANQTGNKVVITANRIKSGESTLTYKLRETNVHGNETTPVTNGLISYDKVSDKFTKTFNIPNAKLVGNKNSDACEAKVNKFVALKDSTEFTDDIELDKINDAFTYKLEYQFDENIGTYDSVQLKDELESVLELVGTKNDISIESANIQNLNSTINLLNNKSGFIIDIAKKNDSYNYLAGKKITVTFQAKIKDDVTNIQLENYPDKKIPNEAILLLDGKPKTSKKVFVTPPKQGTLKIIKVDADNTDLKLQGAKFEIQDSEGNRVGELTTGSDGTAVSKELPAGEYILVEKEAPIGYQIETTDLLVTIEKGKQTIKTITNKNIKGKVIITKVDSEGNPLKDATFELQDSAGKVVAVKTSDSEGKIEFDNLDWDNYILKETKAPEGYRLLTKEIALTIDKEHLLIEKTIKNTKQDWDLPETGGMGTLLFYILGLLIMVSAVFFFIKRKRT